MVPMGPLVYRIAFQPLADATVLVLFIAAIGVHFALTGLGLAFFGAEGTRTTPFVDAVLPVGPMMVKGQSLGVLFVTAVALVSLYLFFERTMLGKTLRATAVNRLGERLIGLKGFVAAIIAGLSSYPLTALAALLVGLLESYSAFFASAFKEVIVFSIIIPVLLWRSLAAGHHHDDEEA